MSGRSRLEVHKKEKAFAAKTLKGAYFVMVTAVSESSRIRQAIQQGVNDYIAKPSIDRHWRQKLKVHPTSQTLAEIPSRIRLNSK